MDTKAQDIIRQLKESKQKNKITFGEIMEALPKENGIPALSLSTLRRVFASNSESKASSFNYEETLLPIAEALSSLEESPEGSQQTKDLEAVKDGVAFLMQQIREKDAMISRLIDRLDQKDEIIHQFLADMRQKDDLVRCLLDRIKE